MWSPWLVLILLGIKLKQILVISLLFHVGAAAAYSDATEAYADTAAAYARSVKIKLNSVQFELNLPI